MAKEKKESVPSTDDELQDLLMGDIGPEKSNDESIAAIWDKDDEPVGQFRATIENAVKTVTTTGKTAIRYTLKIVQPGQPADGVILDKWEVLSVSSVKFARRNLTALIGRRPSFEDFEKELACTIGTVVHINTYYGKGDYYSIDCV